ncbi:hypothetical protein GCM10011491_09950 [Brucella endophytica]|uniref:Uncharacterized protein n=1 Tax=Brucella endophytica TaxID=1963359 RepID=A0A916S7G9_9HYPH|nr:hypothetical protein GCM10011491_09950 [Brucella endophytica]
MGWSRHDKAMTGQRCRDPAQRLRVSRQARTVGEQYQGKLPLGYRRITHGGRSEEERITAEHDRLTALTRWIPNGDIEIDTSRRGWSSNLLHTYGFRMTRDGCSAKQRDERENVKKHEGVPHPN